ncbi:MAG: DUF1805 domain-containing protein [Thermoplasmatales archaeon]|jgi:uncharacterized protein YunC (DUF1805 family)
MIEIDTININGREYETLKVDLDPAPLILVRGKKGFLMCGYLNMEAADKLGAVAVSTSGVKTVDDILNKPVTKISMKARELGVKEGMTGRQALEYL